MSVKLNGSRPLKLVKNLCCSSCNLQYFIKDCTLKGSRYPILLQCGHSVCETCLQQNLRGMKSIVCRQCNSVISLESLEPDNKCFSVSMYGVGNLVVQQNSKQEKDKTLYFLTKKNGNFNYAFKKQSDTILKEDTVDNICEECSLTALWYCENCKSNFCEICWSRVHTSAKSLMKHCKVAICKAEKARKFLKKCPEHENQDLEFFCKGCSIVVCSHCAILQHQGEGHCPITLKEKNAEIISKVRRAAEEAEKITKRMRHTLEKIKLIQNSTDNNLYSDLEYEVERNFGQIHGILQLEEERILKIIQNKSKERQNCIKDLRTQLEKQMENVESLLREYEIVMKRPQSSDLTDLHKKLDEVQSLPCYLISPKSDNSEAKLTFDENLIKLLQIYCTIDFPPNEVFELLSSSDLPEDYSVEPLDVSDGFENVNCVPKGGQQESSVSDVDTLSDSSSRDLAKGDSEMFRSTFPSKPKVFKEQTSYSVRVTYIKNPGEFYVTLNSQRSKQQTIDKRAFQFGSFSPAVPQVIAKDDIFLVKYNVDKKWYRARIVEINPSKKIRNEECVLVYYIDYGNSETVPVSRLRPIPPDLLEEPPLAVKCKLFDCVPKDESWCAESTKTMEKILNNYTATMFIMKVYGDCLEVDLSVIYPEGQIGRDIVSVRDALIFLEFSSFVHGSKVPRKATALKYLNQCLPSVGETFEAVITHVNSPSDFYIQKTRQDASYLLKLSNDLQNCYSENSEKGMIYNPAIGMPCAALFSADHKWYRAQIVEVPGKKMVTVFYVDYGNKETIPWTRIRKLKECFVKRPPLALNCSLAGILPAEVIWNAQVKSYLEKFTMSRDCSVHVYGKPKSKQKLKVLLYKEADGKEICLNTAFIDMDYSVESGQNCLRILQTEGEEEEVEKDKLNSFSSKFDDRKPDSEIDNDQGTSSAENVSSRQKGILKKRKRRSKLTAKERWDLHEYDKKNCQEEPASTEDIENEVDEYNDIFKIKVKILSAESPSSVYVTFAALMEEFRNLQSELNDFYRDSSPDEVKEWTTGSVCAVFDSAKNCWYRAFVLCPLPDDHFKVFLKDIAQIRTVSASALRELDHSFTKCATCAVKCHLADIRSPGEQWPSISCEYLLSEIENYNEIYMTKRGQIENKSLPIELWVQKIVSRGALEPITKEWITLNRLLVNQGLAVPIKPNMGCGSISADREDNSGDKNELENNQQTNLDDMNSDSLIPSLSSQWMPPEPLERQCFIGIPTYVDYNAVLYIYDIEKDGEKLRIINETLLKEYENSKPDPEEHFWSPGQLCIAKYHVDNSWYRGLILQTNENKTYEVLFVDYGNVETCQASDLRKRIKMHKIPILTHKFLLQDIVPTSEDGKWAVPVIDILHSLVVDKKCEINVLKSPTDPSEPHWITMKVIERDLDVAMYLVNRGLASFNITTNDFVDNSDSDNSYSVSSFSLVPLKDERQSKSDLSSSGYARLCVPDTCTGFFIEVTAVKSETEFFANIVDDETLSADLKTALKEFESLQQKLTEECHLQPLLEELLMGQPCCCVHPKNNKWCRGEIVSFLEQEDSVCVFYVDYGSKEFLSKDLLHECKSEWMNLPKMAVKFRLADVKKRPEVSKSVYMKALASCLQKPLFTKIVNIHEEVLEVKLSDEENGSVAYQEMIDKKLMTFI